MNSFKAVVANKSNDEFTLGVRELDIDQLPEGEVTIRVAYSGVNYKDGLAASSAGRVVRRYPMVPGIDLAGTVVQSQDARWREGDEVIVTGFELGTGHYGGFSVYARVPASWVVPLPTGLSLREAMIIGTAGFTAALSIHRLEQNGLHCGGGPVLVTGATGGVGSMAVSMLATLGYETVAATGKSAEHAYLRSLGAGQIVDRAALVAEPDDHKALRAELWAGAVDPVGGPSLAFILSKIKYGGSVALSGLTGGTEFPASVHPFILRGVNVLGIDSVYCPMPLRMTLWDRLASELKPRRLDTMVYAETGLDELPGLLPVILQGGVRGRIMVRIG